MTEYAILRNPGRWLLLVTVTVIVFVSLPNFCQTASINAHDSQIQNRRQTYRQKEYQRRQQDQHSKAYQGNFQSGSEQSVAILREISETLKSIDSRLQKLEKAAQSIEANARQNQAGGIR